VTERGKDSATGLIKKRRGGKRNFTEENEEMKKRN